MPRKFTYLSALASEIDKLEHSIEEEARQIVQKDLALVNEKKTVVFDKARQRIEDSHQAVHELNSNLDKLDDALGGSSSERPLGNSKG